MSVLAEWITIPETARLLGVGLVAARNLVATGELTSREVPGSYVRVLKSEVEALAKACTTPARAG